MWKLFSQEPSEVELKLTRLNHVLAQSFSAVKNDMQKLQAWVQYLNQAHEFQKNELKSLQHAIPGKHQQQYELDRQISTHPQVVGMQHALTSVQLQVQQAVKQAGSVSQADLGDIRHKVSDLAEHVAQNSAKIDGYEQKVSDIWDRLDQLAAPRTQKESRQHFKERILKKITRHSKEYIRNMILSLIKKYERVSAMNLREIVVEEQALCSKSSFYRFLEEIEQSGEVDVYSEGKEKKYIYKMVRQV